MRKHGNKKIKAQKLSEDKSMDIEQRTSWKAVIAGAKKQNIAMVLLGLLPLIIVLLALPYLPDIVPAHYSASGELDRWGSKYEELILPLFMLLICAGWLFGEIPLERSAHKKSNSDMNPQTTIRVWAIGGCCMFAVSTIMTIWEIADGFSRGGTASSIPLNPIVNVATGFVFIVIEMSCRIRSRTDGPVCVCVELSKAASPGVVASISAAWNLLSAVLL
ncbi:DUF1648 domain-containing protein [Bifidobacterium sp. ESL0798]|uniref:DUF1648 domain-containing protein n=1 Tax=Bifidobacterium sp. ESL0798 TaxID=2983235 RepID=UPI0023F7F928|nr:DUF1648 domain-containing protein [Bifidobacterium sp. ESL0798]WEV74770.1 DUF1648 domain-containing protein [Bifidobacterium sp. ESL0798]